MSKQITSNIKVALPGITGGDPDLPYPFSGGIVNLLFSPTFIP